jgi:hypothetical protein
VQGGQSRACPTGRETSPALVVLLPAGRVLSNKIAKYEEAVFASARLTGRQLLSVSWNVWPFLPASVFYL